MLLSTSVLRRTETILNERWGGGGQVLHGEFFVAPFYRLWLPVKPYLVLAVLVVGLKYFHTEKACQDGGTLSSVIAQP